VGTAGLVIDPRFNGPPGSGHGGYCAGRAAALVDAPRGTAVEVTLRRPVPLATALDAEAVEGGGVALSAGGELVMTARPVPAPALGRTPAIGVAAARAAVDPDRWGEEHPFPTCFGCGPERDPSEALRLFAGRAGDDRFAVAWTPADWAGRDGVAAPEFVWAAVDCPSASPAAGGDPVVLGRLTLAVGGPPVPLGRPVVVESWSEAVDGRKHHTAVVLHDGAGAVHAHGRAVWIAVPR
jgi:hypothetical protein